MTAADVEALRKELEKVRGEVMAQLNSIDARLTTGNARFEAQDIRLAAVEKWQGGSPDAISLIVDQLIERIFSSKNWIKLGALVSLINGAALLIGRVL